MKPNAIQAANAEGCERPLMLQAAELALDRPTVLVKLAEATTPRIGRIFCRRIAYDGGVDAFEDRNPRPSDDVPLVYTNAMAAHGGPFDLTLDFGFRYDPDSDPDVQVRVSMSWEHALAMVKALRTAVDGYQEQVGVIPDLERLRKDDE